MAHSHDVRTNNGRYAYTDYTGSGGTTYYVPSNTSSSRSNELRAQTTGTGVNNMNPYSSLNQIIKT